MLCRTAALGNSPQDGRLPAQENPAQENPGRENPGRENPGRELHGSVSLPIAGCQDRLQRLETAHEKAPAKRGLFRKGSRFWKILVVVVILEKHMLFITLGKNVSHQVQDFLTCQLVHQPAGHQ